MSSIIIDDEKIWSTIQYYYLLVIQNALICDNYVKNIDRVVESCKSAIVFGRLLQISIDAFDEVESSPRLNIQTNSQRK